MRPFLLPLISVVFLFECKAQSLEEPYFPLPIFEPINVCSDSPFSETWSYHGPSHEQQSTNGTPYLGMTTSLIMHPDSFGVIYASGNTSGLFKTLDDGLSWHNVTDDLGVPGMGITDIEFYPFDHSVMFATTGQTSNGYGNYSLGLIYSEDWGETWHAFDALSDLITFHNSAIYGSAQCLAVSAMSEGEIYVGGHQKLYHTVDMGQNWSVVNFGDLTPSDNTDNDYIIADIIISPVDDNIVYVSTFAGSTGGAGSKIWVSEDHGVTWSNKTPTVPGTLGRRIRLDMRSSDSNTLFASVLAGSSSSSVYFYKSTDHGTSWELLAGGYSLSGGDGFWKGEFQVSDHDPNLMYYGAVIWYCIKFDGTTWSSLPSNSKLHDDVRDIKLYTNAMGEEFILVASDGGVQKVELNVGEFLAGGPFPAWESLNGEGLQLTQVYGHGDFERGEGTVYGGQDIGTWKIKGMNEYNNEAGNDGRYSITNSYFPKLSVFGDQGSAKYNNSGISIATESTLSLTYSGPFGSSDPKNLRQKCFFNEKDQRQLSFPAYKVATFKLNNNNMQFANLSSGDVIDLSIPDPADISGTAYLAAKAFAFAPSDNNIRYIAFPGTYYSAVDANFLTNAHPAVVSGGQLINRLLKSVDGGTTYSIDLSNNLFYNSNGQNIYLYSSGSISYLLVDPRNADRVYAASGDFTEFPDVGRVIVSSDGGYTWSDMSFGLGQFPINQLVYQDGSDEVIYAATDAGIYRWNKAESVWECFNNGLPPCIVTTMDINPCENSMTIGTYGRGIWKAQLPPIENDIVFTTDYTIDQFEVHSYQNNIVVDAGATLTVKGHVYLKPEKAIIVKPGGHLIMDGALLSNSCPGTLAQGIVVEGNPVDDQSPLLNQGFCELKNETIIENMHNGVLCAGQFEDANGVMQTDYDKTGGIVYAENTTFRNCYVGAELLSYTAFTPTPQHWALSNRSYFKDCDFITERVLDQSPLGFVPAPKAGILLKEVLKVRIEGCRFSNLAIGDPDDTYFIDHHLRGKGIWCMNASCIIRDYCPSDPCSIPIHNEFNQLEYGILSQNSNFISSFDVRNANFLSNYCGIRCEGTLIGPVIRENSFFVEDLPDNNLGEFPVGINLDQTSGYHIQENYFNTLNNTDGSPLTIGIAIENTTLFASDPEDIQEAATNVIYRNWFDGLDVGCNAEGQNSVENSNNSGESYGLEFRCNKFGLATAEDCVKDFNLYAGTTVQKNQGSLLQDNAAGNLFYDDDCDNEYEHWDAGLGATELTAYYYNPNTSQFICEPNCSELSNTNPQQVNEAYSETNTCQVRSPDPTWKPKPVVKGEHEAKKSALLSTQGIFHGVLDGGDKIYLEQLINNPLSESAEIRNELLEFSPNITDGIWQACFDRQPALNPWHLTQVLLSAQPLRSSVLKMMNTSSLPQEFKDMVNNGRMDGLSEKEIFESDLSSLAQDAGELRQDYLRYLLLLDDDTNLDGNVELEDFLLENASTTDFYILAGLRLLNKDIIGAGQALSNCSNLSPKKDIFRPLQIVLGSIQNNTYPYMEQDDIDKLELLAYDEHAIGSAQARAQLALVKEIVYPMDLDVEINHPRSTKDEIQKTIKIPFSVQPTPANQTVWLTYPYYSGMEKVSLSVVDVMGREIFHQEMSQLNGLYELNTSNWGSGFYLVEIFIDGISFGVQKIEIQH